MEKIIQVIDTRNGEDVTAKFKKAADGRGNKIEPKAKKRKKVTK